MTISPMQLGSSTFVWGQQTYLMGILNVTPDSFSGDGLLNGSGWLDATLAQAQSQMAAGAHILDVGGESTRPGAQFVSLEEELARVIPVIKALAATVSVPISIDTYKAEVARQAVVAGASLINDVWGLQRDPEMAQVVAQTQAAVVITHNRSQPKNVDQMGWGGRYVGLEYDDLLQTIEQDLQASLSLAFRAGVRPEQIILDPGIGFGKTVEQNLELIHRFAELRALGYPLLAGTSRKSFIGYTLDLPPEQRLEGTAASVALCIDRGADIIRIHDVGFMSRVARMSDAVVRRVPRIRLP